MNRLLPNEDCFSTYNLRAASETANSCGVIHAIYIISICEYHTYNTCTHTCKHMEFAPQALKGATQEK